MIKEQDLKRLDAKDSADNCLLMLEFVSDAIYLWGDDSIDNNLLIR